MKRLILLTLAALLCLGLLACSTPETPAEKPSESGESQAVTTTAESAEPTLVPFAGNVWKARVMIDSDGNSALLEGDPTIIGERYLDATGEDGALEIGEDSFYNDPGLAGAIDRYIEHNGNRYYFVGSSKNGDPVAYTEEGDTLTAKINGNDWITLKRRSNTEFELTSCQTGVKADLPVGLIFRAA